MKNRKEGAKRWLLQALQDLDDAKFNLSGKKNNIACFLAQQSAEKALKAFLIFKGAEEVWGHSVGELCKDAQNFDGELGKIQDISRSLDKYYIPTRYPNALPGGIPSEVFDEGDAQKAISMADKIINFIKTKTEGEL
ncbi:MAG TPA: HEPN domain-containing protein [Syntrophaceae bacterium]|nr:HEPN domain-containing protein [Syntrophaceae bacterium]